MRERIPRRGWASLALVMMLFMPGVARAAVTDTPFGQSPEERVAALAAVPTGFDDRAVISGLTQPVAVRFAGDGTVFVAEKRGVVKRFSSLGDVTPETVADVRGPTHDYWDRGLIGLAVDPAYPARPYVYVSYAWDRYGEFNDGCGDATGKGCVVYGRIVRVNANTGAQTVLVEDYCQQFPSHSVGGLAFGADGALYASGGDGASFNYADERPSARYPDNPCGDPWREGGSIRSQDLRTSGDPLGLDGTIIRLDPDTPLAESQRASRIVAQGLRNPFRIAIRPGTNEVWSADVGWGSWEEINRLSQPVANYGWPCYEGAGRLGSWDALDNPVCEGLYAQAGAHTAPYYAYSHSARVVPNETCPTGTSSISGLAFYDGGTFPAEYDGALFFADYARRCVWAMLRGANGLPDKTKIRTFITSVPAVDIQAGPEGDLFYVDISGAVRRVRATDNTRPVAVATAAPQHGPLPLRVRFDGRGSSDPDDPDGSALRYEWDFDGDGSWDASGPTPEFTYTTSGSYTARLRVSDPSGLDDIALVPVSAGVPPEATISAPPPGTTWKVGDTLAFSGRATSATGAALPASALSWQLDLHHCPRDGCHVHPVQTWTGVASGSVSAPDHEYPSYLELRLTATEGGVSTTVSRRLDPRTARVRVETEPAGLDAFLGAESGPAPLVADVIVGSATSFGVATPQARAGRTWTFAGWADGGGASRGIVAGAADATYTAAFSTPGELGTPPAVPDTGGVLPESITPPAVTSWRLDARKARLRGARRVRGGALGFGRGDLATAAVGGLDLSRGFTVSAWVRRARGAKGRARVVSGPGFALGVRSGKTRWRRGGVRVDARVRSGRWVQLKLSWDGKRAKVSVDGRVAARRRVSASLGALRSVRLGGGFAGRVAQVRVVAAR